MNGYSPYAARLTDLQLANELSVYERDPFAAGSVACDGFWKYRALLEEKKNRESNSKRKRHVASNRQHIPASPARYRLP